MKTTIAIVISMALMALVGCQSNGAPGGGVSKDEGFRIAVPNSDTVVKQGQLETVTVTINRGSYFKQDVSLEVKATKGISIEPTSLVVKAGDKPDLQFRISATKDAPLGGSRVYVTGTPTTGEPTSADFNVTVVAP